MFPVVRACISQILLFLAIVITWQINKSDTRLKSTLPSISVQSEYSEEEPAQRAVGSGGDDTDKREDDAEATIHHLVSLVRSRPRNLSLVFVGDSITRYQYLSLAYFLRHGRWWESSADAPNNLVNAHSFHHPAHPHENWNEFFLQSNRMLHPMEACDCVRSQNASAIVMERRYFFDQERNNKLVYINLNGNKTHGSWGFYGRFNPQEVFADFDRVVQAPVGFLDDTLKHIRNHQFEWEFATWGDVLRNHVGELGLDNSTKVILNAGIHRHNFGGDDWSRRDVQRALESIHMHGIWKTTTYHISELSKSDRDEIPRIHSADKIMCDLLGDCFNLTWTRGLNRDLYFDEMHFLEPVYRVLNEDLLKSLGALPEGYRPMDRSVLLSAR